MVVVGMRKEGRGWTMAAVTSSSSSTAARLPTVGVYSTDTVARGERDIQRTGGPLAPTGTATPHPQVPFGSRSCDRNKELGLDEISAAVKLASTRSTANKHSKLLRTTVSNPKRPRSKHGGNRPRSTTWPSLRYNIWLEVSNQPFHFLSNDERVTRHFPSHASGGRSQLGPIHDVIPPTHAPLHSYHGNREPDDVITSNLPQLHISSNRSNVKQRSQNTPLISIGAGTRSWRVQSSYSTKRRNLKSRESVNQEATTSTKKTPATFLRVSAQISPSARMNGRVARLPSRMGDNTFDRYLHQTMMSSLKLAENHSSSDGDTSHSHRHGNLFNNLQEGGMSEEQLLELRSLARNPSSLNTGRRDGPVSASAWKDKPVTKEGRFPSNRERDKPTHRIETTVKNASVAKPHLKDKPVTMAMPSQSKDIRVPIDNGALLSDVTPPTTPPTLNSACRVQTYVASSQKKK